MGAALHLRIPPALKTGPHLTALLPAYHIYLLGQWTPRLSTGPKEAERQHQLVANRASIEVKTQTHKSMLEPATNTNQNKREGKRNKKHKKGNKNSNKSYRHSDNMMDSGKDREEEDGGRWGRLGVYMLESRQAEEETRVIPLSGPARQSYS